MDAGDNLALSKKDRRPQRRGPDTGALLRHTYTQLYSFPPPYLSSQRSDPNAEQKAPRVDWTKVYHILVGMFAQSNMSFLLNFTDDDEEEEEEEDQEEGNDNEDEEEGDAPAAKGKGKGKGGKDKKGGGKEKKAHPKAEPKVKKPHPPRNGAAAPGTAAAAAAAAAAATAGPAAAARAPELSRKDKMIRDARIAREKDLAEKDVARLKAPTAALSTLTVQSATGRIGHNLCLIKHYWLSDNKSDALDVWLDLGFTPASLIELLNSENEDEDIDYAEVNGDFIYTELLGEVYEMCLDALKPFLKWVTSIKDSIEQYQLENMGNRLVPLNHKAFKHASLDAWQLRAMKYMKKRESLLVCAPTSSGKTVISTHLVFSIVGSKKVPKNKFIVVAVPSPALAMQVGSMYLHSLKAVDSEANVWVLCEQFEVLSPGQRPRVIVGTPEMLETVLLTFPSGDARDENTLDMFDAEALVIDEIHNLSKSASMERLIHMLPQALVLGLSATMGNPEHLHKWLCKLKTPRKVHLEVVTQRFFNLQQHVFNAATGEVSPISPLAAISPETLAIAAKSDIPFTPYETLRLYNTITPHLSAEACAALKPAAFFKEAMARDNLNRLSLGQAREYGRALVTELSKLPAAAKESIFNTFRLGDISEDIDLRTLLSKLGSKKSDMDRLPALAFSLDSVVCHHAFHQLLQRLEYEENKAHPDRLARLRRLATKYESDSARWQSAYDRLNNDTARMEYERENPRPVPPGEENTPHPDFVVGLPKISANDIEGLWASLGDTVHKAFDKVRKDIKDYIKPYIEGLRRGMALYTKHMPVFYLRHVQRLAQNGSLGLVISDDSLAHGVNMPFRTVIFHGDHARLTPLMVQQMAGRAGRRGLDRSGHVVYMGFNAARVTQLMSVTSPDVTGTDVRNPLVAALSTVSGGQEEKFIFTGLISTFFNPLFQHTEAVRTAEQETARRAECNTRVAEARRIVEAVPQKFRRILFALRDMPEALQICGVLLPKLHDLEITIRKGMDAEVIQLFNIIGRFLESLAGERAWEQPADSWAQELLVSVETDYAAKRAANAVPDLPRPINDELYQAFVLNSVLSLCGQDPALAVPHSSADSDTATPVPAAAAAAAPAAAVAVPLQVSVSASESAAIAAGKAAAAAGDAAASAGEAAVAAGKAAVAAGKAAGAPDKAKVAAAAAEGASEAADAAEEDAAEAEEAAATAAAEAALAEGSAAAAARDASKAAAAAAAAAKTAATAAREAAMAAGVAANVAASEGSAAAAPFGKAAMGAGKAAVAAGEAVTVPAEFASAAGEEAATAAGSALETDLDVDMDQATITTAEFVYRPPLGTVDVSKLYELKDRLMTAMAVLLTIRNECAQRSWETKPWTSPNSKPAVGWATNEIYLRVLNRRIYFMILEYPF